MFKSAFIYKVFYFIISMKRIKKINNHSKTQPNDQTIYADEDLKQAF